MTMERGLFMPYIPADVVSRAKQMDLYTYLHDYEPQELVHLGGGTYCTREHDSLKISICSAGCWEIHLWQDVLRC